MVLMIWQMFSARRRVRKREGGGKMRAGLALRRVRGGTGDCSHKLHTRRAPSLRRGLQDAQIKCPQAHFIWAWFPGLRGVSDSEILLLSGEGYGLRRRLTP